MRLLEVGFEFDGATKCRNGACCVAVSLQFAAEVVLGVYIVRIEGDGLAKLIERALVVCLATEGDASMRCAAASRGSNWIAWLN